MSKYVEIGGLIKKGLSQSIVEKYSTNKDVISVGYANGRATDLFDIQQFGDASESEILTVIVKEKKQLNFRRALQLFKIIDTKQWCYLQI